MEKQPGAVQHKAWQVHALLQTMNVLELSELAIIWDGNPAILQVLEGLMENLPDKDGKEEPKTTSVFEAMGLGKDPDLPDLTPGAMARAYAASEALNKGGAEQLEG